MMSDPASANGAELVTGSVDTSMLGSSDVGSEEG